MSLTEVKEFVKQLSSEELEELALHLESLRRTSDPAWREEMQRRAESPARRYSEEEVKALHERLVAEGQ